MNKNCEICGVLSEGAVETDLGLMCLDCAGNHFNCDCCGDLYSLDTMTSYDEFCYCEECSDNLIGYCESCDENYRRTELNRGHCPSCRESENENGIPHWDYQPKYKFYGKGPLYLGIELEIEFKSQSPTILIDATENPYFFLKHDGSICNGAEVVSHPASFKWINDNFEGTWKRVLKVREEGMRSFKTETCGIHIHMSKKAFSKYHLYKFLRFFRENIDFVTVVSQRTGGNLNQWSTLDSAENIIFQAKHGNTGEKYVAVNLIPPKTVEIRVFRGNLLETAFRKNLEFCKALFDFTEGSSCLSLTAIHFHKFVAKNKKQFPNLLAFLSTVKIAKMKRKPTATGIHRKFPSERQQRDDWIIDTKRDMEEWNCEQEDRAEVPAPVAHEATPIDLYELEQGRAVPQCCGWATYPSTPDTIL